ncbi:MAG: type II secretion system F family protein [Patescibacteria group bacterium]
MAKYFYVAKNIKGEEKTGELEAKDEHHLAKILHQEGYVLISADAEKEVGEKSLDINIPFINKVSLKEKLFFTRNLKVMVSAGISLPRSLRTLAEISKNKRFRKALLEIVEEVNKGKNFSASLSKYPDIFPEIFCSLIRAGEESGTMEESLKNLTQQLERQNELRSKIIGAMIYPIVIVTAMLGIGTLMLVMVIPQLAATFRDLGVELPLTTKIVMALGDFATQRWYFLIMIIVLLVVGFRVALKTKKGKRILDKISLKIPIFASLVQKINSAYTIRTIGSLINSGVPIVSSLEITSGVLGNIFYREALTGSAEQVRKGGKLSEALKNYGDLYPAVVIQMIEVGEETGETSEILQKLADFFEEEVTNATKNMSSIIEPILMLLIGGAIGFFAISMLQPMYSVMDTIK